MTLSNTKKNNTKNAEQFLVLSNIKLV